MKLPLILHGDRSLGSGFASYPKKEYLALLSSSLSSLLELARATALMEARMAAILLLPIP
jgi:hypothetical protein